MKDKILTKKGNMMQIDLTEVTEEITRIIEKKVEEINIQSEKSKLLPILQGLYKWGDASRKKIEGHMTAPPAHPDLVKIVSRGLSYGVMDMSVIWVYRGQIAQDMAYDQHASTKKFPNSIHNNIDEEGYVCAIDVAPYVNGKVCWKREQCCVMAGLFLAAGKELLASGEISHEVRSGSNWDRDGKFLTDQKLDDIVHLELVPKK